MTLRYQDLAGDLAQAIQDGLLRPGERLPSLRAVCRERGTSLMTALAAYQRLEQQGLVEARPRSGYRVLSRPAAPLRAPAIPRPRLASRSAGRADLIAQVLGALADPALLPLGVGCPSPSYLPQGVLRRITSRLLNDDPGLWMTYSMPPGCPGLRLQIARHLQARGMEVGPDEILLTNGAMEGLTLALALAVAPGDLVAVECPTFFGIVDAVRHAGARVLELPADPRDGLDPARFTAAARRRRIRVAALTPTFANPTGSLMPEARRRAWMAALEAHGAALVEDDVYGDLAWDGRRVPPLCALPRRDGRPSLLVGSFSKTLFAGGRVGYIAARQPWIERLIDLKNTTTLANATLAEHVAAECLASGQYERHLRRLAPRLQAGVLALRDSVLRHFPAGTRVSDPRGGYQLWVELPRGTDGMALFDAALEAGISVAPGCLFSMGPGLDRFLRLNGGVAGDLDGAMRTLGELARRHGCLA
jgi:DNA-binding transcriptional MocR family regulator